MDDRSPISDNYIGRAKDAMCIVVKQFRRDEVFNCLCATSLDDRRQAPTFYCHQTQDEAEMKYKSYDPLPTDLVPLFHTFHTSVNHGRYSKV